eukprot:3940587-Rhodomonas_salina.2
MLDPKYPPCTLGGIRLLLFASFASSSAPVAAYSAMTIPFSSAEYNSGLLSLPCSSPFPSCSTLLRCMAGFCMPGCASSKRRGTSQQRFRNRPKNSPKCFGMRGGGVSGSLPLANRPEKRYGPNQTYFVRTLCVAVWLGVHSSALGVHEQALTLCHPRQQPSALKERFAVRLRHTDRLLTRARAALPNLRLRGGDDDENVEAEGASPTWRLSRRL